MPLEVALPMMGNNKKTVKDHIINILTYEWPLSARKLYNILQKRYTLNMSYQAVHKSVKELLEQKIIVDNGDGYQLDIEWVKGVKDFSDKIENHYKNNSKIDVSGSNSNFNFDNLKDYYLFMLDFLNRSADSSDALYQILYHLHLPISLTKEEYMKFTKMLTKFKKSHTICKNSTEADNIIQMHHKSINSEHGIVLGADCADDSETFVANDIVVHAFLSEELKSALDTVYENSKTTEELKKNLDPLMKKKFKIHVVMNRNQHLAENIKKRVAGHFDGKKSPEKKRHETQNYVFDNVRDFYLFTVDLLDKLGDTNDVGYHVNEFLFFPFSLHETEYIRFGKMITKYKKTYTICGKKNRVNMLIADCYKTIHPECNVVFVPGSAGECEYLVAGDTVIELYTSLDMRKAQEEFYNTELSMEEMIKIFKELYKKKCRIVVTVSKNPTIAEEIKKQVINSYKKESQRKNEIDEKDQNEFVSQVLTFQTIHETEKFLIENSKTMLKDVKEKPFLGVYWQHFWVPILLSIDTYKDMRDIIPYVDGYSISRHETIIDQWCFKFYEKTDLNVKIGAELGDIDFVVFGDFVFQVFYPEELKKEIYETFSNIKNVEDLDIKQFFEDIFERKTEVHVIVHKNEKLAEYFKKRILSCF